MDTSETYIKMSDCPEIQGRKAYRYFFPPDKKIHIDSVGNFWTQIDADSTDCKSIWLPTQPQLQEMIDNPYHAAHPDLEDQIRHEQLALLGRHFAQFISEGKIVHMTSMEQLWLAFVMLTNHHKKWYNGRWEVVDD